MNKTSLVLLLFISFFSINLYSIERVEKKFYYPEQGTAIYEFEKVESGIPNKVKISFKPDDKGYMELEHKNNRTYASVILYDRVVYKNVIIPVNFNKIFDYNFDNIVKETEYNFDWKLLVPPYDRLLNRKLREISEHIINELPTIYLSEGEVMDKKGSWTNISNDKSAKYINTYGFTKWIADGIYKPITGKLINLEELLNQNFYFEQNRWYLNKPKDRSPFFGLNWIKNIAKELNKLTMPDISDNYSDVDDIPYLRYSKNTGYDARNINFIFYYLASKDPEKFYFVAFNKPKESSTTKERLMVDYYTTGVVFPYINYNGLLEVFFFENGNTEKFFDPLKYKNDENIFIVKILPKKNFKLPKIKNLSVIYR